MTTIDDLDDVIITARIRILVDIFGAIPRDYLALSHTTLSDIDSGRLFMVANDIVVRRRDDGPYIRDPGSEAPVARAVHTELAIVLWASEVSISTSEASAWRAYPIRLTKFGTHTLAALSRFLQGSPVHHH